MKSTEVAPAIFKIPECPEVHLGAFYATDTYMTVEICSGRILIIQSNLVSAFQNDENSWIAMLRRNVFGISMTIVLLVTGIYQYYKIRGNKKSAPGSKPKMVSGGHQVDEDSIPRRQPRGSTRS